MSASLNDPSYRGGVRQPRVQVLTAGSAVPGVIEVRVATTNWYHASRFEVALSASADPTRGAVWWADQTQVQLEVQVSVDGGSSWTSLIVGNVDDVTIDPAAGAIGLQGRDLTSVFIEARTNETFLNKTSSEVAQILAARHGMTANVDPTTELVGRWYGLDHDHISAEQFARTTTEWDLLIALARRDGYDAFVTGTVLNFKQAVDLGGTPWLAQVLPSTNTTPYASNVNDLALSRSYTLAKDIEVEVRSFSSKTGKSVTAKARRTGAKSASAQPASNQVGTETQRYVYVVPNLTQAQAQQRANESLERLSQHERRVRFTAPGDTALTVRTPVVLAGTGTAFDQSYYVDEIHWSISPDGGFGMDVACKNHDSRSEAIQG